MRKNTPSPSPPNEQQTAVSKDNKGLKSNSSAELSRTKSKCEELFASEKKNIDSLDTKKKRYILHNCEKYEERCAVVEEEVNGVTNTIVYGIEEMDAQERATFYALDNCDKRLQKIIDETAVGRLFAEQEGLLNSEKTD